MTRVLGQIKEFFRRYPLIRALLYLLAAVGIAWEAHWHYSQGKILQALCLDFPFVPMALLGAFASVVEWKSRPEL